MIIRQTSEQDLDAILTVHERAFGQKDEAALTENLLGDPSAAPFLSLIAIDDGRPVGHILFTQVRIADTHDRVHAQILAPLAVVPEFQGRGIGSDLVEAGLRRLAAEGTDLVFVLGHPGYYPRFGFQPAGAHYLSAPYPIPAEHADAWMVKDLRDGIIGSVRGAVVCAEALDRPEYWIE